MISTQLPQAPPDKNRGRAEGCGKEFGIKASAFKPWLWACETRETGLEQQCDESLLTYKCPSCLPLARCTSTMSLEREALTCPRLVPGQQASQERSSLPAKCHGNSATPKASKPGQQWQVLDPSPPIVPAYQAECWCGKSCQQLARSYSCNHKAWTVSQDQPSAPNSNPTVLSGCSVSSCFTRLKFTVNGASQVKDT